MARIFDTDITVLSTAPSAAGHLTRKDYVDGQVATRLALAGGTMTGNIVLFGDPSNALHPATKQYVDNTSQGLQAKNSVQAIETAALPAYTAAGAGVGKTLTANAAAALPAVDGHTPVAGDRLLITGQTTAGDNGLYVVTNAGSGTAAWILTRASDMDDDTEAVVGDHLLVDEGTTHAGEMWMLSAKTGTLDAAGSALTFTKMQFGNAYSADETTLHLAGYTFGIKAQGVAAAQLGAVVGNGLSGGNGAVIAVNPDGTTLDTSGAGNSVEIKNVPPSKIGSLVTGSNAGAITGGTPYDIVHNAGFKKGFPLFFDPVALTPIDPSWAFVDANTLQVTTTSNYAIGGLGYLFLGAA